MKLEQTLEHICIYIRVRDMSRLKRQVIFSSSSDKLKFGVYKLFIYSFLGIILLVAATCFQWILHDSTSSRHSVYSVFLKIHITHPVLGLGLLLECQVCLFVCLLGQVYLFVGVFVCLLGFLIVGVFVCLFVCLFDCWGVCLMECMFVLYLFEIVWLTTINMCSIVPV